MIGQRGRTGSFGGFVDLTNMLHDSLKLHQVPNGLLRVELGHDSSSLHIVVIQWNRVRSKHGGRDTAALIRLLNARGFMLLTRWRCTSNQELLAELRAILARSRSRMYESRLISRQCLVALLDRFRSLDQDQGLPRDQWPFGRTCMPVDFAGSGRTAT